MQEVWGKVLNSQEEGVPNKPKVSNMPVLTDRVEINNARIFFYSGVSDDKILDLNKALRDLSVRHRQSALVTEQEPAKINLHIQSYGGSVFAGISGMDTITEISKDVPVTTIVDGCAASAGTFLSVVGTKRLIRRNAFMLIHQLNSGFWGKYADIKDEVENLDRLMEMIKRTYKEYTKVPMSQLDKILKRDIWWDAETCKRYGLVDEII